MENLLVFVFTLAIVTSVVVLVSSAATLSLYDVVKSQKSLLETFRGDVLTFYVTDGGLVPTDRVLYITEANGELNITNAGLSDVFSVRLLCWDKTSPTQTLKVVQGKVNGEQQPVSIEVLTYFDPYNTAEFNLLEYFPESAVKDGNVACMLVGLRFMRGIPVNG